MKRVEQATSSEKAANCASACGSRSMQMISPAGPIRSATRRAWPPDPKVQSIATAPGSGSRTSSSSPASTGTWTVMSRSSVTCSTGKAARQLRHGLVESGLLLAPAGPVPDLDRVQVAHQHDLPRQLRLVDQRLGKHDPPGGVQLGVERARRIAALEVPVVLVPDRAEPAHLLREAVPGRCRPDRDAGLLLLRENDSLGQLCPELRRDRKPVLRVQRVLVLPEKRQPSCSLCQVLEALAGPGMAEWEEPRHPGPV